MLAPARGAAEGKSLLFLALLTPKTAGASTVHGPLAANYSQAILADHPIVYWRLGEQSGSIAYDASGNERDATYVNHPRKGVPGAIVNDPDTAVRYDGMDDYAVWEPGLASYSGAFSVEAWIRPGQTTSQLRTFFYTRNTGEFGFDFKLTA